MALFSLPFVPMSQTSFIDSRDLPLRTSSEAQCVYEKREQGTPKIIYIPCYWERLRKKPGTATPLLWPDSLMPLLQSFRRCSVFCYMPT